MNKTEALNWLKKNGSPKAAAGLARYGIYTKDRVFGVAVGTMLALAKRLKKDLDSKARHDLALALWKSGVHEGRMLASLIDDPARVTAAQMNAWVKDCDNWGIVDTVCFKLFDQTPFAFARAKHWCRSPKEFIKRSGFVLMACLAAHDKTASDAKFLALLPLIEKGAADDRNFVKKGVSWALRMIGRRNLALNKAAVQVAKRLVESEEAAPRWIGKDALRELTSAAVQSKLAKKKG